MGTTAMDILQCTRSFEQHGYLSLGERRLNEAWNQRDDQPPWVLTSKKSSQGPVCARGSCA